MGCHNIMSRKYKRFSGFGRALRGGWNVGVALGRSKLVRRGAKAVYNFAKRKFAGNGSDRGNKRTRVDTRSTLRSHQYGRRLGRRVKKYNHTKAVGRRVPYRVKRFARHLMNKPTQMVCHRFYNFDYMASAQYQCNWKVVDFCKSTTLESIISTYAPHIIRNPATGVIEEAYTDMTQTASLGHAVQFVSAYKKVLIKNNSSTPCVLELYWMKQLQNGTSDFLTLLNSGLTSKGWEAPAGSGMTYNQDINVCWKDGNCRNGFKQFKKCYKYRKYYLNPGDEITPMLAHRRPFLWHPYVGSPSYQKYITHELVIKMTGVLAHDDETTSNCCIAAANIDMMKTSVYSFGAFGDRSNRYTRYEGDATLATVTTPKVWGIEVEETAHAV